MVKIGETTLHRLLVGGEPVGFTESTGTLHLAGDDLTQAQWEELERRINLFYERAGLRKKQGKPGDPNAGTSSFLSRNLQEILARDRGLIADPPWWLRGKYSGVIGREQLWQ